jgi:hypothetical protein
MLFSPKIPLSNLTKDAKEEKANDGDEIFGDDGEGELRDDEIVDLLDVNEEGIDERNIDGDDDFADEVVDEIEESDGEDGFVDEIDDEIDETLVEEIEDTEGIEGTEDLGSDGEDEKVFKFSAFSFTFSRKFEKMFFKCSTSFCLLTSVAILISPPSAIGYEVVTTLLEIVD